MPQRHRDPDDRDHRPADPVIACRFSSFGELADQFTLLLGHPQHVLGPDGYGSRPGRRRGFGSGQHADVGAPG